MCPQISPPAIIQGQSMKFGRMQTVAILFALVVVLATRVAFAASDTNARTSLRGLEIQNTPEIPGTEIPGTRT